MSGYKYDKVSEGLKSYKIGEKKTVKEFNNYEKEVITLADGTKGLDRFYVMALYDVDSAKHGWYNGGMGQYDKPEGYSVVDFKESNGRVNTDYMINPKNGKWTTGAYGTPNENDLWGVIQNKEINTKYNIDKWFVPSKAEWSAFGDMLYTCADLPENVTTSNYEKYGLKRIILYIFAI